VANLDELRLYSVLPMPHTQSVVVSTPSIPVAIANNSMETDSHDVPLAATNKNNKSLTRIPKRKRGDTAEGDDVFEVV
jgi:hypothetical protein